MLQMVKPEEFFLKLSSGKGGMVFHLSQGEKDNG